jgi:hypothetical protein
METDIDPKGDLLKGRLQLSPLLCSLRYRYPVHTITKEAENIEYSEQGAYLMVCRDREYTIRRLEGSPASAMILERVAMEHLSGEDVLRALAKELGRTDVDAVIENGLVFLEELRSTDMLLGTSRS